MRSIASRRRLVTNTSARSISLSAKLWPSGRRKSTATERLLRLSSSNAGRMRALGSPIVRVTNPRIGSPVFGSSSLITSAPQSPNTAEVEGPATHIASSTTLTPSSGRSITFESPSLDEIELLSRRRRLRDASERFRCSHRRVRIHRPIRHAGAVVSRAPSQDADRASESRQSVWRSDRISAVQFRSPRKSRAKPPRRRHWLQYLPDHSSTQRTEFRQRGREHAHHDRSCHQGERAQVRAYQRYQCDDVVAAALFPRQGDGRGGAPRVGALVRHPPARGDLRRRGY